MGRLYCFYYLIAVLHALILGYFLSCKTVFVSFIYVILHKNTISFVVLRKDITEIMKYFSQCMFHVKFVVTKLQIIYVISSKLIKELHVLK